jgi:hypothetical protein
MLKGVLTRQHMSREEVHAHIMKNLAPNGMPFIYELKDFLAPKQRPTKQQHMAYMHLKGYGINKIRDTLKMGQPTIESFKAYPTYEMFPLRLQMMWQTTPDIEMHHQNMIKHFAILPNICGGFH